MEIVASAVGSIVSCVCTCIGTPVVEEWKYMKSPTGELETLRNKRGELATKVNDINNSLQAQEEHRKRSKTEVQNWLNNVEKFMGHVNNIEEEVKVTKKCPFPDCCSRVNLGKHISMLISEATDLLEKGSRFSDGSLTTPKLDMGMPLSNTKLVGKTASKNLEIVWECLVGNEFETIGIWGIGGSGKTATMMEIHNKLLQKQDRFDNVIWVTVSKDSNVHKVQDDIAKAINLDLSNEQDEVRRASLLLGALQQRKRIVLILDDMWKSFSLHEIGIPEPTKGNGCKLALTTRSIGVCQGMRCNKNIKIELLSEEEARELFMSKVDCELAPEVKEIAMAIVKECARLPLALIKTGATMRGKEDIQEWKFALEDFKQI